MLYISKQKKMVELICLTTCILIAPASLAQSAADCAAEADRASRNSGSVIGGAGRGAVRGAAFGAIVGDSSKSARRGAATGAIVGGARKATRKNNTYNSVYDACMHR